MITNDEIFVKIQRILAFSDIHPEDCKKINDLIIELSKENQELKHQQRDLLKYLDWKIKNIETVYNFTKNEFKKSGKWFLYNEILTASKRIFKIKE